MAERPGDDGLAQTLRTGQTVLSVVVKAAVLFASAVVLLQLLGVIDAFDVDDSADPQRAQRLPAEFLYLDDERVDAYLGQLRGGLAPSERQSLSVTETRNAELGLEQVVQVGGSIQQQRVVERRIFSRAADRYYVLEAELAVRFADAEKVGLRFRDLVATPHGCGQIAKSAEVRPGQIVRILGAHLRVPTYTLALAKVAHASQYVAPGQPDGGVSPEALSRLAERRQSGLRSFVESFGPDPRLPFRLEIAHSGRRCTIFLPVRYSKLAEAPSLLTGRVTVVGKIVRILLDGRNEYFDVETAARYGRAVLGAGPRVKKVLALPSNAADVVNASARVTAPALVVLPLAIYK